MTCETTCTQQNYEGVRKEESLGSLLMLIEGCLIHQSFDGKILRRFVNKLMPTYYFGDMYANELVNNRIQSQSFFNV